MGRFTLLPSTDSSDLTTNGCLPRDQVSVVWRRDGNGTLILTQVTNQGLCAIGIDPNEGRAAPETAPTGRGSETPQA